MFFQKKLNTDKQQEKEYLEKINFLFEGDFVKVVDIDEKYIKFKDKKGDLFKVEKEILEG